MERHIQIQTPLFVPAAALEEYFFHIAACEWSVINPIIIHNQSDLLSYGWKEKGLKPFEHQFRNLLYFSKSSLVRFSPTMWVSEKPSAQV